MKKAATMKLSGNDYAKVAERLKIFKEENPKSKQESTFAELNGVIIFTTYLWKDKADLIDLMKSGVTDKEILRSSSDANGTAKGESKAKKDFEKLETIALGRALANLGYLASGEIASSEEMEEFQGYKETQRLEKIDKLIQQASKIKDVVKLREFYKLNTGYGKEFEVAIVELSKSLKPNASTQ